MALNTCQIQGRVARDPYVTEKSPGKKKAYFTLIWSEKYGRVDNVLYLDCDCIKPSIAEIAEKYLHKGTPCVVEGKLLSRNKKVKDGSEQQMSVMNVQKIHFTYGESENNGPDQYDDENFEGGFIDPETGEIKER